MIKYITLLISLTIISACSEPEEFSSGEFSGGQLSEKMKLSLTQETYRSISSNDSTEAIADFELKVIEEHMQENELAVAYCKTLDESRRLKCVEKIGVEIYEEDHQEGRFGYVPVTNELLAKQEALDLRSNSPNCNVIWISVWNRTKAKDYIFKVKTQMWTTTKAFLGSRHSPDSCGRRAFKVNVLQQTSQAFNEYCRWTYWPPAQARVEFCSKPGYVPINIPTTTAFGVDHLSTYSSKSSSIAPRTNPKCKITKIKGHNTMEPHFWNFSRDFEWNHVGPKCRRNEKWFPPYRV